MHLPAQFEVTDKTVLHDVIARYPLGTWVVSNGDELNINHIPFILDATLGAHGTLIGHVARANPVWQQLKANTQSVIVFHAEQGYVSPSWYESKQDDDRVVPTWNYAVVHARGSAKAIEDAASLLRIVSALTDQHEVNQAHPWKVSDAPADYIDKLLGAIVGVQMPIESLQGKFKLSQNRSAADRKGVLDALQVGGDSLDQALAIRMQQNGK